MSSSIFAKGNTALISGAASGIGLAVAKLCRKHGMNLALVDNNSSLLSHAKQDFGNADDTETYEMDVSKLDQWETLREKVKVKFGTVELLFLNAAVAPKGTWGDSQYFQSMLDVNLFGQLHGLNTFVPFMQASDKKSSIVMTGSKQGITNPPGNAAYNASKSAIRTLAEHLSFDLRSSPISVHLLVPGSTFTGLSGNVPGSTKEKPAGAWWPEQVADYMYEKMAIDQFWILCPDNDVTEDKDQRRMLWQQGDAIYRRKPLSRWREESKDEAQQWMDNVKI